MPSKPKTTQRITLGSELRLSRLGSETSFASSVFDSSTVSAFDDSIGAGSDPNVGPFTEAQPDISNVSTNTDNDSSLILIAAHSIDKSQTP